MSPERLFQELASAQDTGADLALLHNALAIESITGNETPFARFLGGELEKLGLTASYGEFQSGRENVWASRDGAQQSPHLMFVGHTDTVHVRGWKEYWNDDARADAFAGAYIDDHIWGRGASDLKGGICAAIAGLRLVQLAGHELRGRITFAFVGDEESGEPGTGVSAGAKDLVRRINSDQIAKPDFAVYVEPTNLNIYTAQIGFFIADITVTGQSAYFGRPELGIDALKATHEILSRIWIHEAELDAGPAHELVGASSILVTGIVGGGYIAVPGECKLSLIRTLRPGEILDDAVKCFEDAIASADLGEGISVSINYPAGRDHPHGGSPVEISPRDASAQLLRDCVRRARPEAGAIKGAPYWSESPFFINEVGCPTVYCAPGDIAVAHTFEERINANEYLAAIRGFALFIATFCGLNPNPTSQL